MRLSNYWWLLIWIFVAAVFVEIVPVTRYEEVLGKKEKRWGIFSAFLLVFPYLIWAGFRGDVADTYAYRTMFKELPLALSEWMTYLAGLTKDKGFYVLSLMIKFVVRNNSEFYFLILAAFQIICIVLVFRKYSCDYWFSIFVFVASTDYISWMFNGIRQFTAVTLIFVTTSLLLKKKYVPVIAVILIASTIHGSALLMLPIILVLQGKAWNKRTLFSIAICIIALMFVDQFTDVMDYLLADTQYTNVVSDWKAWEDNGTNPIRVFVYSVPTILAIVGYKWIRDEDDPVINLATNASIISTGLYLVSMGTSGIFIGRLPIFVSL